MFVTITYAALDVRHYCQQLDNNLLKDCVSQERNCIDNLASLLVNVLVHQRKKKKIRFF
jgi:hypothetical protein